MRSKVFFLFLLPLIPCLAFKKSLYEDKGNGVFFLKHANRTSKPKIAMISAIISKDLPPKKKRHKKKRHQEPSYADQVSFGTTSKELYAQQHGYDFIVATKPIKHCFGIPAFKDCQWFKLCIISQYLEDYDWIFWTDADSVILNFSTKLENFINPKYEVIACSEIADGEPCAFKQGCMINTGQVFFKNTPFSKFLIEESWTRQVLHLPCHEQGRMNRILAESKEYSEKVLVYPGRTFNASIEQYQKGDFLIHLYKQYGKRKLEKFNLIKKTFELPPLLKTSIQ